MNKAYKIHWQRTVYFSGTIVINNDVDPRIYADAHARTGELAMRCHNEVVVESRDEEVQLLLEENICSECEKTVYEEFRFVHGPFVCRKCRKDKK